MNRLICGLVVLAGCVMFVAEGRADEPSLPEGCPLADMKMELPRLVKIIEELGQGHLDAALDRVEAELPEPFADLSGSQEDDERARWRRAFRPLTHRHTRFESVEVIGYQPISSAARTLVLIGHGHRGPIQFRIRMFRYQGEWKITNLSYQGDWEQIEADTRYNRLETPINFPLEVLSEI